MTFKELDKLVHNSLKNRWDKKVERRDYRKLEEEDPKFYKGKAKSAGLMFLVDVTDDLYIDINIYEDYFTMRFRKDDDTLIRMDSRRFNQHDDIINIFLNLIDEYLYLEERLVQVSNGIIPNDLLRESKIEKIPSKE